MERLFILWANKDGIDKMGNARFTYKKVKESPVNYESLDGIASKLKEEIAYHVITILRVGGSL